MIKIPTALITDTTISTKSLKVIIYLWSLPDDWKINNADIAEKLNLSNEMVAKSLKELITTGWINRYEQKRIKGKFANYDYHLNAIPFEGEVL